MPLISKLKTDKTKEQDGVWIVGPYGFRLKVARLNNKSYINYLRKLMKPHQKELRGLNKSYSLAEDSGKFDTDGASEAQIALMEELAKKGMARHVLLDWEDLQEEIPDPANPGKTKIVEIPYSEQKALEFLTEYNELYLVVLEASQDLALFREQVIQEQEGNS